MKRISFIAFLVYCTTVLYAWSPQGNKIKTIWAEQITPENAWQTYPRPQLKRETWKNLNGLWEYQVTDMSVKKNAVTYNNEILVPFAIESSLSGIAQKFTPTDKLWYRKEFTVDLSWKGQQIMLHFGAVDYECQVWVNNKPVGSHKGGNNPFSFDITKFLKPHGPQVLELSVTDPTDTESISRGKQQLNQRGIWYTPVSGIWQTVWLEPVNRTFIRRVLPEADIKNNRVELNLDVVAAKGDELLKIKVMDKGNSIKEIEQKISKKIDITFSNPMTLWSPETPELYDLEISLYRNNQEIDKVATYFAMREVTMQKDEAGYNRVYLNGNPVFQYGTLDQGWWPDGLLTPPSPEAMIWDMIQLKEMGFNTIRKHIKVEPALYYYYADSLGIMVWQDMPSGFATERKKEEHIQHTAEKDWNAPPEVAQQWSKELDEMIDDLRFFPSITTWVIFNEGWGQHNTIEIVERMMEKDTTRIINGVSGWTDRKVGHMYDLHNYPATSMMLPEFSDNRISVLGEFGGLGLPIEGSLWNPDIRNWGYKNIDGGMDLLADYSRLMYDLETLIAQGLSAAIYTQTTDVEGEVNGLITYDRKVTKLPVNILHLLHSRLYSIPSVQPVSLIPHAQKEKGICREVIVNGTSCVKTFPALIEGKAEVCAREEFMADKPYKNLSLWFYSEGETSVWLNGVKIFDQIVRFTRNYNQFNISNYVGLLKEGKNVLEIKIDLPDKKTLNFDYGLTAF